MGFYAGNYEMAELNNASQEAHPMNLRKADLRPRINGRLTWRYVAGGLSSFAALELVG